MATIRRDVCAKLFRKLEQNPLVLETTRHETCVEVTFYTPRYGRGRKWYLNACVFKESAGGFKMWCDVKNTPHRTMARMDVHDWDNANTSIEMGVYRLDSLKADAPYEAIRDYLDKACAAL